MWSTTHVLASVWGLRDGRPSWPSLWVRRCSWRRPGNCGRRLPVSRRCTGASWRCPGSTFRRKSTFSGSRWWPCGRWGATWRAGAGSPSPGGISPTRLPSPGRFRLQSKHGLLLLLLSVGQLVRRSLPGRLHLPGLLHALHAFGQLRIVDDSGPACGLDESASRWKRPEMSSETNPRS